VKGIKGNMEVSEDILKQTRRCKKNFSCLNGSGECCCEVEGTSGYNVLFVNPESNRDCNYCTLFGKSFLCHCPTRNEIYNQCNV
jgi:hypothetical protein